MTHCITSRRGNSKLLELVPNPFDDINKICSKQRERERERERERDSGYWAAVA